MTTTSSTLTRVLGFGCLAAVAVLGALALVFSPPDVTMADSVRLMYIHVPSALAAYIAVGVTAFGSVAYLWRRSTFWDLVAASSAEIGVLFTALMLVTGMLWGKPTWGVYWVWDGRLTSSALLFILLLGYLAVRSVPSDRDVRAKRSAVAGLIAALDVPIVHYSVDWWRGLHQPATIGKLDADLDGLMLFSLFWGIATFVALYAWLVIHRFRVAYLEEQIEDDDLTIALAERRAEAGVAAR